MRIRATGIVIKVNAILLMEREKEGKHYWTFPGGGVEPRETNEEAVIRELQEETSIKIIPEKLLYVLHYQEKRTIVRKEYIYLCTYVSGEPALDPTSVEKTRTEQLYKPQWVKLEDIPSLLLYPEVVKEWVSEDYMNGFSHETRSLILPIE